MTWEWYNVTTAAGQQLYVPDEHIKVKNLLASTGIKTNEGSKIYY